MTSSPSLAQPLLRRAGKKITAELKGGTAQMLDYTLAAAGICIPLKFLGAGLALTDNMPPPSASAAFTNPGIPPFLDIITGGNPAIFTVMACSFAVFFGSYRAVRGLSACVPGGNLHGMVWGETLQSLRPYRKSVAALPALEK